MRYPSNLRLPPFSTWHLLCARPNRRLPFTFVIHSQLKLSGCISKNSAKVRASSRTRIERIDRFASLCPIICIHCCSAFASISFCATRKKRRRKRFTHESISIISSFALLLHAFNAIKIERESTILSQFNKERV